MKIVPAGRFANLAISFFRRDDPDDFVPVADHFDACAGRDGQEFLGIPVGEEEFLDQLERAGDFPVGALFLFRLGAALRFCLIRQDAGDVDEVDRLEFAVELGCIAS